MRYIWVMGCPSGVLMLTIRQAGMEKTWGSSP